MTEFDGSTGTIGTAVATAPPPVRSAPEPDDDDGAPFGTSSLELLRGIVEEMPDSPPWVHVCAKGGVRLTCITNVDNVDYQRWLKAALPRSKGRGQGSTDPTKMNQLVLTTRAILFCCNQVEVRNRKVKDAAAAGAWITVTGPTGETLELTDDAMLKTFRTPDPAALLVRLFGRDADVISAGLELLEACGYIPSESDDDSDPT